MYDNRYPKLIIIFLLPAAGIVKITKWHKLSFLLTAAMSRPQIMKSNKQHLLIEHTEVIILSPYTVKQHWSSIRKIKFKSQ